MKRIEETFQRFAEADLEARRQSSPGSVLVVADLPPSGNDNTTVARRILIRANEEYLTIAEVAALLKCSVKTVRNKISAGRVPERETLLYAAHFRTAI